MSATGRAPGRSPSGLQAGRPADVPVERGAVGRRGVSLIGAPTDVGAGTRGASMGPEALRVADIQPTLEGHGLEVIDQIGRAHV